VCHHVRQVAGKPHIHTEAGAKMYLKISQLAMRGKNGLLSRSNFTNKQNIEGTFIKILPFSLTTTQF